MSELTEFLSAYYLCANANSPSFSQNSPSLPQNSVSSLLRNSTLETVFRLSFLFCPFLSFFGTFPIFSGIFPILLWDGPGIFPIRPFSLSRPFQSTYEEQSRKGPRHNLDLSRKKWESPWFGNPLVQLLSRFFLSKECPAKKQCQNLWHDMTSFGGSQKSGVSKPVVWGTRGLRTPDSHGFCHFFRFRDFRQSSAQLLGFRQEKGT